jgi:hypothetical protein
MRGIWSARMHLQYDVEKQAIFTAFPEGVTLAPPCITPFALNNINGFSYH